MTAGTQDLKTISAREAYAIISEKKEITIVDVRTPEEFRSGHITGSINIDYNGADFEKHLAGLDKSKFYLIYCRSGNRSSRAHSIMKKLGFKKVYDFGGIIQWKAEGFPIEE